MTETKMVAIIPCDTCIHKALCRHAEDMQKVWTAVSEADVHGRCNTNGSEQYTSKRVTHYDFVEAIVVTCKYYHSCETFLNRSYTPPYELTRTASSTEGTIHG